MADSVSASPDRDSLGRFVPKIRVSHQGQPIDANIVVSMGNVQRVAKQAAHRTRAYAKHWKRIGAANANIRVVIPVDRADRGYEKLSDLRDNMAKVVRKHAQMVLLRSLAITPIDTGALRNSAGVGRFYAGPNDIIATIVFDIRYAVFVHEMLELKHAPPTQAKFLETPVDQSHDELVRAVRAEILKIAAG